MRASVRSSIVGAGSTLPSLQKKVDPETEEKGLTAVGGGLAIVSTIIGGGIVGLPYALFLLGLVLGFLLNFGACYVTYLSGFLYLALRDIVPRKPNSMYEIGYILQGRSAIFLVSIVTFVVSAGLMLIYFIVFGQTCAQVIGEYAGVSPGS